MSEWYYAENNEQKGPINESELKANFTAKKLPADTLVWKEGMDNWTPANQVPALSLRQSPGGTAPSSAVSTPSSTTPVDVTSIMGTPETLEVTPEDADKNKVMGILAYLGILCLVPILAAKDSPFAKYHANQGLVLFIAWIALAIALAVLDSIASFLPGGLYFLFSIVHLVYLAPFVLMILGIINAAGGKCVPLPVIGGIKLLK